MVQGAVTSQNRLALLQVQRVTGLTYHCVHCGSVLNGPHPLPSPQALEGEEWGGNQLGLEILAFQPVCFQQKPPTAGTGGEEGCVTGVLYQGLFILPPHRIGRGGHGAIIPGVLKQLSYWLALPFSHQTLLPDVGWQVTETAWPSAPAATACGSDRNRYK